MLERLSDRWKAEAGDALLRVAVACAAAASLGLVLAFLSAAAFLAVLDRRGLVAACLAGAAFYVVAALVLLAVYAAAGWRQRRAAERAKRLAAMEAPSPLADPRVALAALQIVQAVGFRRLLPILALGGAAFALARRKEKGTGRARPHAPGHTL